MDEKRVNKFLKAVSGDMKGIVFEQKENYVTMRIGNFFMTRNIDGDYDYAVKKLFEDFLTNTSLYYINTFWEL